MGKKKKTLRSDGFVNAFTGQGVKSRDPFASYSVDSEIPLYDKEIDNLYTYNGIARKIVEIPADDAVSEGFKLINGSDEIEQSKAVMSELEDIKWDNKFSEALSWERAMGGSAILMMINDGRRFDEPLDIKSADRVERLDVYSKQDISTTGSYYSDPNDPKYGRPYMYTLINEYGNSINVHESRLLLFRGGRISKEERRYRDGWGGTVFDVIQRRLIQYETSMNLSLAALSRLSQSMLKLNGLADILSGDGGEEIIQKRLQAIDMARHFLNTIAIDSADDYQQYGLALGGIPQISEEFEVALAAATNIPVTILFGRSPAGLNATGRSDFEQYYKMVNRIQTRNMKPQLSRLISILNQLKGLNLPEKYTIEFNPLWTMSEPEKASVKQTKVNTEAAKINAVNTLVSSEIITKEEARKILSEIMSEVK